MKSAWLLAIAVVLSVLLPSFAAHAGKQVEETLEYPDGTTNVKIVTINGGMQVGVVAPSGPNPVASTNATTN